MNEGTGLRDNVIPQRPPGVERGWFFVEGRRTGSSWHPASLKENPQEEEGHFHWKGPCQGKGGPPEGPSHCGHLGRNNRMTEPVYYLGPVGCPWPLLEPGSLQKILGMKQKVPPGAARGGPCPLFPIHPSPEGSRIWGRGPITPLGCWPGRPTGIRARGWPFPPGVSWEFGGRKQGQVPSRTPNLWEWPGEPKHRICPAGRRNCLRSLWSKTTRN